MRTCSDPDESLDWQNAWQLLNRLFAWSRLQEEDSEIVLACAIKNNWNNEVTKHIEESRFRMYGCPQCPAKLSGGL